MVLKGKIYKGIGGFYYVHTPEGDYECRAKGIFRNRNEKPLVGDDAEIEAVQDSEKEHEGSVIRILPRKNQLIRPAVERRPGGRHLRTPPSGSESEPARPLPHPYGAAGDPGGDLL